MIVYSTAIKNQRLQVVIDEIDGGASPGTLKIGTAGMALVLATIPLGSPSFNPPVSGVIDLASTPRVDPDTAFAGDAAEAAIYDGDGNLKISGLTVGVSGSGKDIIISAVQVAQHQRLEVTSGRIRHA